MIESMIEEMEEQIDSDNFMDIQEDCMIKISETNLGLQAVEPLLCFIERHPMSDFGIPGPIVHYVEEFYKKGYEELLIESIMRRPTLHTIWMLKRIKNAEKSSDKYETMLRVILERKDVEKEIKNFIDELFILD